MSARWFVRDTAGQSHDGRVDESTDVGLHLRQAGRNFFNEMQPQRFFVYRLPGLGIFDQPKRFLPGECRSLSSPRRFGAALRSERTASSTSSRIRARARREMLADQTTLDEVERI